MAFFPLKKTFGTFWEFCFDRFWKSKIHKVKQKSKENSKSSLRASKSSDSPPKRNLQSCGATKEISSISTIQLEKKGRENPQVFWKTVTTAFTLLLQILVNPLHFTNSSGDQKKLSCTVAENGSVWDHLYFCALN